MSAASEWLLERACRARLLGVKPRVGRAQFAHSTSTGVNTALCDSAVLLQNLADRKRDDIAHMLARLGVGCSALLQRQRAALQQAGRERSTL